VVDKQEETQRFLVEECGEEGEDLEEIIEQADEGDLLIAERAIIGFERVEREPKEES